MEETELTYVSSVNLAHHQECVLLGVTPDFTIYIEEMYGEDEWIAQHIMSADGVHLHSADENHGKRSLPPLALPANIVRPRSGGDQARFLDFSGPRLRGMREPERIQDMLHPLSISLKVSLIERFALPVIPPTLLGLAESYITSEADILSGISAVVCRRLRLAYVLPEVRHDAHGIPYDYDTFTLHLAHLVHIPDDDLLTEAHLASLPGARLNRPLDCVRAADHVFIADGGTPEYPSAVHIWRMRAVSSQSGLQSP